MELRSIHYFIAVAEERNFTRASEKLHISQPALSRQMMQLEDELGTSLFIRGNRQLSLTEADEYFYSRSKEIIDLVSTTKADLNSEELISGELHIGAGETQHTRHLFDAFQRLRDKSDTVTNNVESASADYLLPRLDQGLYDFILTIGFIDQNKYEVLPLPWVERWGVPTRVDSPLADLDGIRPKDIYDQPLIVSDQTFVDSKICNWLGRNLDHFNVVGSYNLLNNAIIMVEAGLGSALTLDGVYNTHNTDIKFIPLEPELTSELNLIWQKHRPLSNVAKAFLEEVKKISEEYGGSGT